MMNLKQLKNIEEAQLEGLDLEWNSLEISDTLLKALKKEFKFAQMTPVQAAAIPLMLKSKDVIVEAKTGSGKTLAFLIPVIDHLIKRDKSSPINKNDILALILSPTRELASQIHQELRKLLRNPLLDDCRHLHNLLIVGGSSVASDIDKYTKFGANIIVATPGRLSTLMEMADNNLSSSIRKNLSYLIFDEADQLLSFGFEKNLSSILGYLPKQRRTSLFSATQTSEVEDLIKSGLRNPIKINVNSYDKCKQPRHNRDTGKELPMPDNLINYFHICDSYIDKLATMVALIKREDYKKVLVFLSTSWQIDYFKVCLEDEFKDRKTTLLSLHRRLKSKRKSIFKKFKSTKRCILLASDIMSRGIDVSDISCVIHLDLPVSPECYVHRSGRSGHQIGLNGTSVMLVERHELDYIEMCRRRQIVLQSMKLNEPSEETTLIAKRLIAKMKGKAAKDEAYQTLGIQAFVSYVRFYSSKLCLRELLFSKLPIAELANSFGLIRLPKMPELKNRRTPNNNPIKP